MRVGEEGLGAECRTWFRVPFILEEQNNFRIYGGVGVQY